MRSCKAQDITLPCTIEGNRSVPLVLLERDGVYKITLFGEYFFSSSNEDLATRVYESFAGRLKDYVKFDNTNDSLVYSKEEIEMLTSDKELGKAKKSKPKKDFHVANPALSFITAPAPEPEEEKPREPKQVDSPLKAQKIAPDGYKVSPQFVELKSKRVQLVLQPSIESAIKALAKEKGQSLNETVTEAIKDYLTKEGSECLR